MREKLRITLICTTLALMCLACSGCFGMPQAPSIAAQVGDKAIYEDDVTAFIESFRATNDKYETDSGWAEYLVSTGYTAESIRTKIINDEFIPQTLIQAQCEARSLTVSDQSIEEAITSQQSYYEVRYGADSWNNMITLNGYDRQTWRDAEENRMLKEKLMNSVIEKKTPTSAQIQNQANDSASNYNGSESCYISFPSEETAKTARETVLRSAGANVSVSEFSRAGTVVDAGWSSLKTSPLLEKAYYDALTHVGKGKLSDPVKVGDNWCLILCTDIFNISSNTDFIILSDIPKPIYNALAEDAAQSVRDREFDYWLSNLERDTGVTINKIPSGLSYDVDLSLRESTH